MHFYQYEVVLLLKKEYWQMAIPDALNTKVHTFTLFKIWPFLSLNQIIPKMTHCIGKLFHEMELVSL